MPDSAPSVKGVTGGENGPEPHNLGGLTRSSGVGAGVISSSAASIPKVIYYIMCLYLCVVSLGFRRLKSNARLAVSQDLADLCLLRYVRLLPSLCSR